MDPLVKAAIALAVCVRSGWQSKAEAVIGAHHTRYPPDDEPLFVYETPLLIEPYGWRNCSYLRNAALVREHELGASNEELARRYRVGVSSVKLTIRSDWQRRERLRRKVFDQRDDRSLPLQVIIHEPDLELARIMGSSGYTKIRYVVIAAHEPWPAGMRPWS